MVMLITSHATWGKDWMVKDQKQFKQAVKQLQPGDSVTLADGTWTDFDMVFKATGTADKPVSLRAQTAGKVILSGQSSLRLAGQYLLVSGLVFKNGYSPIGEVISFRRNSQDLAFHSRVTEVVIDNYNNPNKFDEDKWVVMYGQYNRFDHSHLVGKKNAGVTMAVRLDSTLSQQNHHRIDHNYFGPRPVLGSNGGETLRIGTSKYSLSDSFTLVENNYFDRCNGEVEIISNKSGKNTYRNNVFFESRGTLTLRHGNGNLVENNVFLGNGQDHTGGIRIINRDQIVRNNYLEGLTGYRFGSGLTVMNGVPNSKINRYHQVRNALIEHNSLINVDNIQLAAGSDQERTATPVDSSMRLNLIVNQSGSDGITLFDDVSGIQFSDNLLHKVAKPTIKSGFDSANIDMQRAANGLLYPVDKQYRHWGASTDLQPIDKNQTGVSWYPKTEPVIAFDSGQSHQVLADEGALAAAIERAQSGDILVLAAGQYHISKILPINKVLTLRADKPGKVDIYFHRSTLFDIQDDGSLKLSGLTVNGQYAPDAAGNKVVRTSTLPMIQNYRLVVEDCLIENLNINHSFHFLDAGKRSFADRISLKDNVFNHISGDILRLNKETDDLGIYNAEYVTLTDNQFDDVGGALIKLYRGGTDESTFGPHYLMQGNALRNIGGSRRNKQQASVWLHGVQVSRIDNNQFYNSQPVVIQHTVGEPQTYVQHNLFADTAAPDVQELVNIGAMTAYLSDNQIIESHQQ
ncbi:chondroitinase-B domain-containing protein [Neptunicella sp. SCSIO 80796]|uniref:chondroitinase-B domain-containing protein n=1 Tax=Neptunicella plasticusilytica TaxID=3117012 RepID=UPI003A4DA2E0